MEESEARCFATMIHMIQPLLSSLMQSSDQLCFLKEEWSCVASDHQHMSNRRKHVEQGASQRSCFSSARERATVEGTRADQGRSRSGNNLAQQHAVRCIRFSQPSSCFHQVHPSCCIRLVCSFLSLSLHQTSACSALLFIDPTTMSISRGPHHNATVGWLCDSVNMPCNLG